MRKIYSYKNNYKGSFQDAEFEQPTGEIIENDEVVLHIGEHDSRSYFSLRSDAKLKIEGVDPELGLQIDENLDDETKEDLYHKFYMNNHNSIYTQEELGLVPTTPRVREMVAGELIEHERKLKAEAEKIAEAANTVANTATEVTGNTEVRVI